jgi:hypothetical protein
METLKFKGTTHEALHKLASSIERNTATAFKKDALAFAMENKAFAEKPELWIALGNDYRADVTACEADKALQKVISNATVANYVNRATRAVIALIVGNYTAKALQNVSFEVLAETGMDLLETSGDKGTFVAGYVPASRRKQTLIEKGINPETGGTLSEKAKADWIEKQAEHNAKAKAERAKKASDKAAKELAAHVNKDAPTIPHAQTHLIAESDKIAKLRARIDAAISPDSKVTKLQMVQLLTEIKAVLPVPVML